MDPSATQPSRMQGSVIELAVWLRAGLLALLLIYWPLGQISKVNASGSEDSRTRSGLSMIPADMSAPSIALANEIRFTPTSMKIPLRATPTTPARVTSTIIPVASKAPSNCLAKRSTSSLPAMTKSTNLWPLYGASVREMMLRCSPDTVLQARRCCNSNKSFSALAARSRCCAASTSNLTARSFADAASPNALAAPAPASAALLLASADSRWASAILSANRLLTFMPVMIVREPTINVSPSSTADSSCKKVFHSSSVMEKVLFIALGAVALANLLLAIFCGSNAYRILRRRQGTSITTEPTRPVLRRSPGTKDDSA